MDAGELATRNWLEGLARRDAAQRSVRPALYQQGGGYRGALDELLAAQGLTVVGTGGWFRVCPAQREAPA